MIRKIEKEHGILHADESYDEGFSEDFLTSVMRFHIIPSNFMEIVLEEVPRSERSIAKDLEFLCRVYRRYRKDAVE